jgi:hypothetical protein
MMESWATITAKFPKKDQPKWQALLEGLAQNQHGAYLEECAEAFGEQAEELVGFVLDEWEEERGEIDTRSSEIYQCKAVIRICGYRAVEASVQPMVNFLNACGATHVDTNEDYDSNGS